MKLRTLLSSFVYLWFLVLIILPLGGIIWGSLSPGLQSFYTSVTSPEALFSLKMTFLIAVLTVAINTVFGTLTAMTLARGGSPWIKVIDAIVDLPFAVSPVIAGLAIVLIYGPFSLIGGFFQGHGVKIVFALPGMVIATLFVTFPFVVRELVPLLQELGSAEQQAAYTLGASPWRTFWSVTLPAIKWPLTYGMVLTLGRAIGEFGAVIVVSGGVIMLTQTATQFVYQASENNEMAAAYSVSVVLALTSFVILLVLQFAKRKQEAHVQ